MIYIRGATAAKLSVVQILRYICYQGSAPCKFSYTVTVAGRGVKTVALYGLELETKVHPKVRNHGEGPPTRAFSWLKAATTAFTFKTRLRHYANYGDADAKVIKDRRVG